jgi:hypothetical protein
MIELYRKIDKLLDKIDFNELYPGFFRQKFALYNKDNIFLKDKILPWNEDFIGNTSILFNDEYLAIWNLEYKIDDMMVFTSKLVHEMFHAYQMSNKEPRFANEFDGLNYSYDINNIRVKLHEISYLKAAIVEKKKDELSKFLSIRKERYKTYQKEVIYEMGTETIEGTAYYVELKALKLLDKNKYNIAFNKSIEFICNPEHILKIRELSYHIGALVLLICDEMGIVWPKQIKNNAVSHSEYLMSLSRDKAPLFVDNHFDLSFIEKYFQDIKQKILDFMANSKHKTKYQKITGFDPMNTVKIDNYYLCTYFVRVFDGDDNINIFRTSVVEQLPENIIVYT